MKGKRNKLKWIGALAGTLAAVLLLRAFALTWCLIPSTGMENTLYQGERIAVNKWSYGLRLPGMKLWGYHRIRPQAIGRGDVVVFNNPAEIHTTPADCRALFISRCIGLPGDTIWVDSLYAPLPHRGINVPDKKVLYSYPRQHDALIDSLLHAIGVESSTLMGADSLLLVRGLSRYEYYLLQQECDSIHRWMTPQNDEQPQQAYPLIIPGKGIRIEVTDHNRTLLLNTLLVHEQRQAAVIGDTLYIDQKPATWCELTKDYHWMVSDNSVNWSDSRLFGLVPHDHVIGKAAFVWFSKERDTGFFSGHRWNRYFQTIR